MRSADIELVSPPKAAPSCEWASASAAVLQPAAAATASSAGLRSARSPAPAQHRSALVPLAVPYPK